MPSTSTPAPANSHEAMQAEVLNLLTDMATWRARVNAMSDLQYDGRPLFFPELPSTVKQLEQHLGSMDRIFRQTFQLPEASA
ncbi:MAG: hypothetical protein ACT6RD_11850 [Brevundimonas sp.]|uniref:hypothetical protein n=1 Tax=Brevundimonas sp. TaxID=1871086 RepID=UPI004034C03B